MQQQEKGIGAPGGCGEATGTRGMQDAKQRGWVVSLRRSPGLACCKSGGRDIFFF